MEQQLEKLINQTVNLIITNPTMTVWLEGDLDFHPISDGSYLISDYGGDWVQAKFTKEMVKRIDPHVGMGPKATLYIEL